MDGGEVRGQSMRSSLSTEPAFAKVADEGKSMSFSKRAIVVVFVIAEVNVVLQLFHGVVKAVLLEKVVLASSTRPFFPRKAELVQMM